MSLATKYRPVTFDDIIGQDSIIKILRRQVEINDIKNCYLFCGPSGDGKTTTARALAYAINHSHLGLVEIDAASNNGVDNIRELISQAGERSVEATYKIIILDECHALTSQSWQALLKTIEEPPKYTIFMFCTTDPQKVPATIINRCMRFNLNRISSAKIKSRLDFICKSEGFTNFDTTTDYISKICNGQMRDAIAFLEKTASYSTDLNIQNAITALGTFSYTDMFNLINSIIDRHEANVLQLISNLYNTGCDFKLFIDQFITFCLDIMKYNLIKNCDILQIPNYMETDIKNASNFDNAAGYYSYIVDKLLVLKNMLKTDSTPKSTVEVMLLQLCRLK